MRILPVPVTQILMTLAPHGGQRTARRNAWSAMVTDSADARDRREAAAAVALAAGRAQQEVRAAR